MNVCTGKGDNGDHCCYISGQVCEFLFTNKAGIPRCSVWDDMDTDWWRASPPGRAYEEMWPNQGYTCRDWPQNIPEVITGAAGKCCWNKAF